MKNRFGKLDKKIEVTKKLQEELERRTELETKAIRLISDGKHEKAVELLKSIDDGIIKEIMEQEN